MIGLTIFSHSLRQVLGNLGMAVRISGWLALVFAVLGTAMFSFMPDWFILAMQGQPVSAADMSQISPSGMMLFLFGVIAAVVFFSWSVSLVAIAWHRFILLEEYPSGFIPYRRAFKIGRYFWVGVGISLLAALVVGLIGGILGLAFGPLFMNSLANATQGSSLQFIGASLLIGLILGVIVAVIYLRMALVLPAIALNENMTIGEAWGATGGYTGAILMLALVLATINVVVSILLEMVLGGNVDAWFSMAVSGLYQWFFFMLNISVLSTLYGHIVQKRDIF